MKKPSQYITLVIMILSAAFAVWLPIYIWPKEVVVEFDGIIYEAGNTGYAENTGIEIDGHMNKRVLGGKRFLGKIIIENVDVREDWETQTVRINFNTKGMGTMYYLDETEEKSKLVPYAVVSMGDNASSVVLSLVGAGNSDTHMFAGSTMIAGPASDREGAVALSNKLMKDFLENPIE